MTSQRMSVVRRKERRMRIQTSAEKMPNQISQVLEYCSASERCNENKLKICFNFNAQRWALMLS